MEERNINAKPINTSVPDKKENVLLKTFTAGIIRENPLLVGLLGLCPVFIATTSINNALGMSVAVLIVLFFSNLLVSLIRKIVPSTIRVPVYIVIISSLVTIVDLLLKAFTPELSTSLGVFIPLITVNCIILGRAEAFARKNSVGKSVLDALGMSIGFALACLIIAFFREVLGTGGITFVNPFTNKQIFSFLPLEAIKIPLLTQNAGGFIVFGLVLGVFTTIRLWNSDRKTKKAIEAKKALLAKEKQETAKEVK